MPKVSTTVNLLDANRCRVTLLRGDDVPDWALDLVTNPRVLIADSDDAAEAAETQPVDPPIQAESQPVDYAAMKRPELDALCDERSIDKTGNKPDLIERLVAADKAAAEKQPADVWEMNLDELKELAKERGVDLGEATTTEEIATVLSAAKE